MAAKRREDPALLVALRALFGAHVFVALIDLRLHALGTVPVGWRVIGLAAFALSMSAVLWSIVVNRHFVPQMLVETGGHRLVTGGPYGLVRHPGYAGMAIGAPASALALGSWAALVPAVLFSVLVVIRATREDDFLRRNLAGYVEYSDRVRYRVAPFVW